MPVVVHVCYSFGKAKQRVVLCCPCCFYYMIYSGFKTLKVEKFKVYTIPGKPLL